MLPGVFMRLSTPSPNVSGQTPVWKMSIFGPPGSPPTFDPLFLYPGPPRPKQGPPDPLWFNRTMDRSYDYLIWFIDLRFRPIRFQDQILAIFSKLHLPVIGRTDNGFESLILLQGREGSEPQRINYSLLLLLLLPAPQVSNLKPEIFWRENIYIVFLIMLGNTVAPPPESSLYFTPISYWYWTVYED